MPARAWCSRRAEIHTGRADKEAGAWYFHRCMTSSPTSTLETARADRILQDQGVWNQLGGYPAFAMDAVPFVIATKGAKVANPVEQYD